MKTYQKDQSKARYQKAERKLDTKITPELISKCKVSAVCQNAVKQLEMIRQGQGLTSILQQLFTSVHDFVITQISINNAHRSGVLLLSNYYKATKKDSIKIMKVMKHKTFRRHGAAQIIIDKTLFELLETYIKFVRSKLP